MREQEGAIQSVYGLSLARAVTRVTRHPTNREPWPLSMFTPHTCVIKALLSYKRSTMKYIGCMLLLLTFLITENNAAESTYTTKYDGIDLDEILANERMLTGYVNCLLEQGPCTPDGKELKSNLPDAIEHDCEKCTERQREGADKVMHYIIDHRPEDWTKLEQKYNSDGTYKMNYLSRKHAEETKSNATSSEGTKNSDEEQS
ncbi:ejaculatory bulb-specific protein 3-like [Anticarsia gemmatalis]|uniref:ejaculatory bulb-specific protein 3-like n=1 Tax=Anticarsia gemmatalis TaxID=129554 RepID=UPI003F76D10C